MRVAQAVLLALAQTTWDVGWEGQQARMGRLPPRAHELAVRCQSADTRRALAIRFPGCPDWTSGRLSLAAQHTGEDWGLSLELDTHTTLHGTLSSDANTIVWSQAPTKTIWRRVAQSPPRPITITSELHVVDTRHGKMLTQTNDLWIGHSLREYGEWSEHEVALFRKLLMLGDNVVDAGANVGAFTIPLAKMVGYGGQIFAFEAQQRLHRLLGANLEINGLTRNVRSEHLALGDHHGNIVIPNINYTVAANFGGISLVDQDWETKYGRALVHRISLVTLDGWYRQQWMLAGPPRQQRHGNDGGGDDMPVTFLCPRLIKIDVEGMEYAVLRGANETIRRCRPRVYAENNCVRDSSRLIRLLIEEYNMRVVWDLQPYLNLNNHRKSPVDIFPPGFLAVNVLAVPAEEDADSNAMPVINSRVEVQAAVGYTLEPYRDAVLDQLLRTHRQFASLFGKDFLRFRVVQAGNETFCRR